MAISRGVTVSRTKMPIANAPAMRGSIGDAAKAGDGDLYSISRAPLSPVMPRQRWLRPVAFSAVRGQAAPIGRPHRVPVRSGFIISGQRGSHEAALTSYSDDLVRARQPLERLRNQIGQERTNQRKDSQSSR